MPKFQKKNLSLYLRTGCQRQLALSLYRDSERAQLGMPRTQKARAGLGLVGQAGYTWQDEKINELGDVFGKDRVLVNKEKKGNRPLPLDLKEVLPRCAPYDFIVEASYDADIRAFCADDSIAGLRDQWGHSLEVPMSIPDIIQVLPPMLANLDEKRRLEETGPNPLTLAVASTGDVLPIPPDDPRLRLRVIDIKQSSEPSAHYFAEVVYYSVTLASWLIIHGFEDEFVVVAAAAVWPGSYDHTNITRTKEDARKHAREPEPRELAHALEKDIEIAHFDVFVPRLRRFFESELPHVLSMPWDKLPWYVSYKCSGCEFLGYPWVDKDGKPTNEPQHCWPTADATDHLSRVAGLTRACAQILGDAAPNTVSLSRLDPGNSALELTPSLRAKRSIFPHRAAALRENSSGIIPNSGGDALMPRWPNLRVYLFLEYDLASAITAAFGIRAFWIEPLPYKSAETPARKVWTWSYKNPDNSFQEVFIVNQRTLEREREELLKFLRALRKILNEVYKQDLEDIDKGRRGNAKKPQLSTYQIYLWDEAQRKHLVRVVGRHLGSILADSKLRTLAWLFPPPDLLTHSEDASFRSPFTLVSDVVQNTVAVPVPHHYTLLELVQTYRPEKYKAPQVHPLFRDPLSDIIPGERLHEMWEVLGDYLETMNIIRETVQKKLRSLGYVGMKLEKDLSAILNRSAAPTVIRAPRPSSNMSAQSQLWYEFTRLNAALHDLDAHAIRAMPAHEREARMRSAHLEERLEGAAKMAAVAKLQKVESRLPAASELVIYRLAPNSRDVNIRPPSLGYALAPRSIQGFLNHSAYQLVRHVPKPPFARGSVSESGFTQVSVVAIDRNEKLIALKPGHNYQVSLLEASGKVSFKHEVMLDPISGDFLSSKVRSTLEGIGRPASAREDDIVLRALGIDRSTGATTPENPASEFLWGARLLSMEGTSRTVDSTRVALEKAGVFLNEWQWSAWTQALTRRLTLVWGPPGTGKSKTLRAIVLGASHLALSHGHRLRVLISANTYAASDNVLTGISRSFSELFDPSSYRLVRLHSQYSEPPEDLLHDAHSQVEHLAVKTTRTDTAVLELQTTLNEASMDARILIVVAPPQQVHNLAIATKNKTKKSGKSASSATQRNWFDLVVIDEASQLDVASATLLVSKAADKATFVLAGDDKQLSPIHPASAPDGLEHVVGSLFGYIRYHHKVEPQPLQVNYRSNSTIVEFIKHAGYDPGLRAEYPELRLVPLGEGLPKSKPSDWPDSLFWSPDWSRLLDPKKPTVCFLYQDELASQVNEFEADAIATMLWILYGRIDRQLSGEHKKLSGIPRDEREFWERGVGVVTPHRAQMSKVVNRLQALFPDHDRRLIWGAVDTVERFQGQERDMIFASFGLGDTDLIQAEEDFLFQLNRFNVMASRARAKLVVLATHTFVEHLPSDPETLQQSRLLKYYVEGFCGSPVELSLGHVTEGKQVVKTGYLRSHC